MDTIKLVGGVHFSKGEHRLTVLLSALKSYRSDLEENSPSSSSVALMADPSPAGQEQV
jgi:hypothetical protein